MYDMISRFTVTSRALLHQKQTCNKPRLPTSCFAQSAVCIGIHVLKAEEQVRGLLTQGRSGSRYTSERDTRQPTRGIWSHVARVDQESGFILFERKMKIK